MADTPTFKFAGEDIPFVSLDQITVDESVTLYNWSGLTIDKVMDLDGFHQGFTAGLMHLSLARAKPHLSEKQARDAIGEMKLVDMINAFEAITVETEDARPPQTAPETSSENDTSGADSNNGGDASQENNPDPLSGDRSLGSSLRYGPVTSER